MKNIFILDSPKRSNMYMFGFVFYMLLANIIVYYTILEFFFDGKIVPEFLMINHTIVFLLPILFYMIVTRQKPSNFLNLNSISFINILLIIGMSLTIQPFMMLLSALSSLASNNDVSNTMANFLLDDNKLLLTLLSVAVFPAVLEELVFRGFLLSGFKNYRLILAALINGLFFGVMHLDLQQFLYAFLLGFLFVYFVHYTKSLFASIIAHFTINCSQILLMQIILKLEDNVPKGITEVPETPESMMATLISTAIIAGLITPIFIFLFHNFIKRNRTSKVSFFKERYLDEFGFDENGQAYLACKRSEYNYYSKLLKENDATETVKGLNNEDLSDEHGKPILYNNARLIGTYKNMDYATDSEKYFLIFKEPEQKSVFSLPLFGVIIFYIIYILVIDINILNLFK